MFKRNVHSTDSIPCTCMTSAADTWPGLLDGFLKYVNLETEGAGGKGKPLDPAIARTLKHLVQAAELESRSGESQSEVSYMKPVVWDPAWIGGIIW